jgi:hypothetical protein
MSRFRFPALLVLSLGVVAMLILRRDRRQPVVVATAPAPPVPAPAEPVVEAPVVEAPVVEEPVGEEPVAEEPVVWKPVAEEPVVEAPEPEPVAEAPQPEPVAETPPPAAPVQQLYPETDGVSDVEPERSYWEVPKAPPAHWSDPPELGERQSA